MDKDVQPAHIIKKTGIDRVFGHQIFSGRRRPSHDKVIQLAIGFNMGYEETQSLLVAAGKKG